MKCQHLKKVRTDLWDLKNADKTKLLEKLKNNPNVSDDHVAKNYQDYYNRYSEASVKSRKFYGAVYAGSGVAIATTGVALAVLPEFLLEGEVSFQGCMENITNSLNAWKGLIDEKEKLVNAVISSYVHVEE